MTRRTCRSALLVVVLAVLTSCGVPPSTTYAGRSDGLTPTPPAPGGASHTLTVVTPTAGPVTVVPPTAVPLTVNVRTPGRGTCAQWLVLSSDQATYRPDELAEIRSALAAGLSGRDPGGIDGPAGDATGPELPPQWASPLLRTVEVGSCSMDLQITNIGASAVQIEEAGLHLIGRPTENALRYRLIDVCRLVGGCAPRGAPAIGAICFYSAGIVLRPSGVTFTGAVRAAPDCPTMTLRPRETGEVLLTVTSDASSIYDVEPELVVSGGRILLLPDLVSIVTFARPEQFGCYDIASGTLVLDAPVGNPPAGFCPYSRRPLPTPATAAPIAAPTPLPTP